MHVRITYLVCNTSANACNKFVMSTSRPNSHLLVNKLLMMPNIFLLWQYCLVQALLLARLEANASGDKQLAQALVIPSNIEDEAIRHAAAH